jgi:dihydrofolate reductase
MGRKTWDSLGKPLIGRDNVVVTRGTEYIEGVTSFHPSRLPELKNSEGVNPFHYPTTFVIGGKMLYDEFPNPEFIYHTTIHSTKHRVDTYGPSLCLSDYELLVQRYIFDVTRPKQIPITTNIYRHKASK